MIRVALKFGAFVLVCLFFTGYLAFTIGNLDVRDPLARNTYTLTATFDDVTGLLVNDNVKVAGVVIGKVTSVSTENGRAVVKMRIDDEHDDIPKDGTTAGIRWRNLIGQRYVYLYPGSSGGEALQGGDEIEDTASAVDLGELFEQLGPIVTAIDPGQVNKLLETLTQAFDGREDEIGGALDDLATLARGLASRDEAIGRLVENLDTVAATLNRRDAQIEAMLENLVTISESFGDNTATLDAALTELGAFGTDLSGVLDSNAAELDRLLSNLALVTDTAVSKLPELDTFLASFADTTEAIFRAGNRGEFLNQKILCAFIAPPADSQSGCPTGDPITGLSSSAQVFDEGPVSGGAAISSLLTRAVQG
ncbi:MAG TPA: MlaD family protein [Acidimicrobiales bacterium]|nr:MlaD family protein [Acidimicrobiales bacterium]